MTALNVARLQVKNFRLNQLKFGEPTCIKIQWLHDVFHQDSLVQHFAKIMRKQIVTTYWWVNHKQTFAQEVGGNYISFTDDGVLIVSPAADSNTLARWQVISNASCGKFRQAQLPYLAFHREFILKQP